MAGDRPCQPVQALLEHGELSLSDRQRRVLALAHGRLEVVVETLDLGHDAPDRLCPRRHLGLSQRLDRVRERERVRDARGPGHALGHEHRELERDLADPAFRSAPLEEQALGAVGDVLAAGLDQELRGLEHARPHRSVRDHEHARTGEPLRAPMLEAHVLLLGELDLTLVGSVPNERLETGVALRCDPEQVVDLALEPVRRRYVRRDCRVRVAVQRRSQPRDRVAVADERVQLASAAGEWHDEQHHQPAAGALDRGRDRVRLDRAFG